MLEYIFEKLSKMIVKSQAKNIEIASLSRNVTEFGDQCFTL